MMTERQRKEFEALLSKNVSRAQRDLFKDLLDELDEFDPRIEQLRPSFWQEANQALFGAISAVLLDVYMANATDLVEQAGIGIDFALVNKEALEWVNRYGFDLVSGLNDNSREALRSALDNFYQAGQNIRDLEKQLSYTFGPARSSVIAATETTRAASESQRQMAADMKELYGIELYPVWITEADEAVCDYCGPLDGKEITDGIYPPAHPNCRCSVNFERRSNG